MLKMGSLAQQAIASGICPQMNANKRKCGQSTFELKRRTLMIGMTYIAGSGKRQ
ncbi:MAG: hypothetical protein KZQ95_03350 [Candidatus Thiodiazotropha sp. (ex Epidulcina cf. delphinae)]|nr:hypothetical protein [Candidatus Thiodiazotropha sp. (ex Epidulcina cf. delphinae)]